MPVFGPNLRRALVAVEKQACCAHCASASARIAHYERIADAPDAIVRLRRFIFDLAVRGKLVPQNTEDEPASELIKEIAKEIPLKIGYGKDGSWPFDVPTGWIWTHLGRLAARSDAGWSPETEDHPRNGNEWGVLKFSAVSWDKFRAWEDKQVLPGTKPRLQVPRRNYSPRRFRNAHGRYRRNLQTSEELMSSILLKVYITPFAEKGIKEAEKWSCDAAKEALNVVNAIWLKAKIAFVINDCVIDKPLDMAKSARNNDQRLLDVLSLRHKPDNLVHVYLVNPIENLSAGGSSYVDSDPEPASFIQWYGNVVPNGRAWAHELGHLMSLDHVEIDYADERQAALRSNLMTKGLSMGRDLTDKQIGRVKGSKLVKRFDG